MPGSEKPVNFSRLLDWVEGRLPEDEARSVGEQVARADSKTLADVAWLRKFARAADNVILESPPQEVRDALIARFEARTKGRRTSGFLTRVLARLAFDSDLRPAVGVRAVGVQQGRRQLVYSAGSYDVALNLRSRVPDQNLDLDGQVFPREAEELETFSVQLLQGDSERALTVTDDFGSFAFRQIPPEVYGIVLSTERVEISIAPIALSG